MPKLDWMNESHNIVDIIHGVIPYNGLEAKIIENTMFSRLHRIFQSSLAYLTFPSNKVHRHEHSMGVMHLSGLFFFHSICNSRQVEINLLLDEIYTEFENWLDGGNAAEYLTSSALTDLREEKGAYLRPKDEEKITYPDCDLYRQFTPVNLKPENRFLYYTVYEAVRLVGLLHDIGHLPYSHITEFALQRLYQDAKVQSENEDHKDNNELKEFLQIMRPYETNNGHKSQIHEMIGQELVKKIFISIKEEIGSSYGTYPLFMAAVFYLSGQILKATPGENTIYSDLHRIVDGVIDSDRMDYCYRDLYCAGISKELPQCERIFNSVQILYRSPPSIEKELSSGTKVAERERCYFSFTSKALGQIDTLLQKRWDDFSFINYHHRVHKHELLLELTIYQLGREALGLEQLRKEPGGAQGKANGGIPSDISYLWRTVGAVQKPGAVDILISQVDDEWLNSLLKHHFFKTYGESYEARRKYHNDPGWNRLDELITGQKHYHSLFKRTGGFRRFDRDFRAEYDGSTPNENDTQYFFDNKLRELVKINPKNGIIAQYYMSVNERLVSWLGSSEAKEMGIFDCCLDENNFSVGIGANDMESIYIVSSQAENESAPLKGRSNISNSLNSQKDLFPSFHVYFLPEYDPIGNTYRKANISRFRFIIAGIMAKCMKEMLDAAKQQKSEGAK